MSNVPFWINVSASIAFLACFLFWIMRKNGWLTAAIVYMAVAFIVISQFYPEYWASLSPTH